MSGIPEKFDNEAWHAAKVREKWSELLAVLDGFQAKSAVVGIVHVLRNSEYQGGRYFPAAESVAVPFIQTSDGNRVWCVRCKGWKATEGGPGPCPDDTPDGECPILEADESRWRQATIADASEAIEALYRELRDLDDEAAGAARIDDERNAEILRRLKAITARALAGDKDRRSLIASLEQICAITQAEGSGR